MPIGVYPRTKEMREKYRLAKLGKKLSPEHKKKISEAHKGPKAYNWKGGKPKCINCGKKLSGYIYKYCHRCSYLGEKNPYWKGDAVKYVGLHRWVQRHKGKAVKCAHCGKTGYCHWANISGEYKRDLDDFVSLCVSCHKFYDQK
jgi:hypothetical protein